MCPEVGRETSFWKPISGQEPKVPILPTRSATHMASTMMCVNYNSWSRGDNYCVHCTLAQHHTSPESTRGGTSFRQASRTVPFWPCPPP